MVKVHTEHLDDHTARLTVEVEPERIEKAMRQAARELAKKTRIPGFRPGKAPFNVVVRMLGRDYVLSEALDRIMDELYKEALDAAEIDPYAPGELEELSEDGQRIVFRVAKQPDVKLGDYRSIRASHEPDEVTDEMVEEMLEELQARHAQLEDVDRPAEFGDQLSLSHLEIVTVPEAAEDKTDDAEEDEPAEDVEAEDATDDGHDEADEEEEGRVLLHEHNIGYVLHEDPSKDFVTGLSQHLVGAKAGDALEFELALPDDYEPEELAGSRVKVTANVSKVQARQLPELDDEFAKLASEDKFETLEELRQDLRRYLEENAQKQADEETFRDALDKLVEGATVHYPPQMVEEIIDDYLRSLESDLEQQYGLNLERYLTITGTDKDALRDQYREAAIRRVKRSLALGAFAEKEQLQVSDAAIEKRIDEIVKGLSSGAQDETQLNALRGLVDTPQLRNNIKTTLLEEQITDHLVAIARGEEPPVGGAQPEAEAEDADEAEEPAPEEEPAAETENTEPEAPQAEAEASSDEKTE